MTTTIKNPKRIPFTLQDQCDHNVAVRAGKLPTQPLTDAVYDWSVRKFGGDSYHYVTNRDVAKERGAVTVGTPKRDVTVKVTGDKLAVHVETSTGKIETQWFQLPKQD